MIGTTFESYLKTKSMKNIILTLSFLVSISLVSFGQDSTSAGQSVPDMMVKDLDGKNIQIQDYSKDGKITVISFWATWCKPCIKELTALNEHLEEWAESYNMQLVAVSVDDARNSAKVKPFASGRGWNFDILLDPNGDLQRAMNVSNPPTTMIVDQKGDIVWVHTSYVDGDEYELEEKLEELSK
jgi:peroxiredoxin